MQIIKPVPVVLEEEAKSEIIEESLYSDNEELSSIETSSPSKYL